MVLPGRVTVHQGSRGGTAPGRPSIGSCRSCWVTTNAGEGRTIGRQWRPQFRFQGFFAPEAAIRSGARRFLAIPIRWARFMGFGCSRRYNRKTRSAGGPLQGDRLQGVFKGARRVIMSQSHAGAGDQFALLRECLITIRRGCGRRGGQG